MEREMEFDVRFTVRIPAGVEATPSEVEAWLRFYLHATGTLAGDNPLIDHEPEATPGTVSAWQRS